MVAEHAEHPEASLVYSDFYECTDKLKPLFVFKNTPIKKGQTVLGHFTKAGTYKGSDVDVSHLKVFKKSFYNLTSGVNSTLLKAVDRDLVLKLEEVGKLVHVDEILYLHRMHDKSISYTYSQRSYKYKERVKKGKYNMYMEAWKRRNGKEKNN
jgi:hypothetical protein